MISSACWEPLTTMICSASQRTARAVRRYAATAWRKGREPMGEPYVMASRVVVRECRATRRDQIASGKWSTAGSLRRNAPKPPSQGSGVERKRAAGWRATTRRPGPLTVRRALRRFREGVSSGGVPATKVPDPLRLSK